MKTIADPACGTGGFFLSAYKWISENNKLNKKQKEFLRDSTFRGNEIVPSTRRMCLMNLFLHNIGSIDGESEVERADALLTKPTEFVDYVAMYRPKYPYWKKSTGGFDWEVIRKKR